MVPAWKFTQVAVDGRRHVPQLGLDAAQLITDLRLLIGDAGVQVRHGATDDVRLLVRDKQGAEDFTLEIVGGHTRAATGPSAVDLARATDVVEAAPSIGTGTDIGAARGHAVYEPAEQVFRFAGLLACRVDGPLVELNLGLVEDPGIDDGLVLAVVERVIVTDLAAVDRVS
jgi:hypothetical protein